MNYKLIDIDDMDITYTFTASEIENVDILDMINLHLRGGHSSTYTLPLLCLSAGKRLTIRNKDFGLSATHRYTGVKMVLRNDQSIERQSYWFCFKNQWASFLFDGSGWVLLSPPPLPLVDANFIQEHDIVHGYVDILESLDPAKQVLFNNIDLSGFDASVLRGRFFREGEIGFLQEDCLLSHNHDQKEHKHDIPNTKPVYPIEDLLSNILGNKKKYPKFLINVVEQMMKKNDSNPLKIMKSISLWNHNFKKYKQVRDEDNLFIFVSQLITGIENILKKNPKATKELINIEKELQDMCKKLVVENWENILKYILDYIDNLATHNWPEAQKLILAQLDLNSIEYKVIQAAKDYNNLIKNQVHNWFNKNQDKVQKLIFTYIEDTTSSVYKIIVDISNTIKDKIVIVDSSLTECEKTNKKNVPVSLIIPNMVLKAVAEPLVNKPKPREILSDISIGGVLSDRFNIQNTENAKVDLESNLDGIEETRPDNIQGQYIIKCY